MINKEVVVFQIEDMLSNINKENLLSFGGHIDNGAVFLELMTNVLTLLKEKEQMKPIYNEEKFGDFLPHCPVCEKVLPSVSQYGKSNFCHSCGQAVKWE